MTAAPGAVLVSDELTGRLVYVARDRDRRPQPAEAECPFCPGGAEALADAGPYAFPNRWPPVEQGRSEVIVYGPEHHRDLGALTAVEIGPVIDLWADRSEMQWRYAGTRCVLVFENRGEEAGATVPHPHSQLFGLPFLPPLCPAGAAAGCPACAEPDPSLLVESIGGWAVTVPAAPPAPYTLRLVPRRHVATAAELDRAERHALAEALGRAVRRLDGLFSRPMPYQMWMPQVRAGHLTVTICGLLRGPDRLRILGAAEVATGIYFSPLTPHRAAATLRQVDGVTEHDRG